MKRLFLLLVIMFMISCENSNVVNEEEFEPEIIPAVSLLSASSAGEKQVIQIKANIEYDIDVTSNWLSVEKVNGGIKIVIDSNIDYISRAATVAVYNVGYGIRETIKVTQKARRCNIGDLVVMNGEEGVAYHVSGTKVKLISVRAVNGFTWQEACDYFKKLGTGGWQLLSIAELQKLYDAKSSIATTLYNNGGGFLQGWYWSSEIDSSDYVDVFYFEDWTFGGAGSVGSKHSSNRSSSSYARATISFDNEY